MRWLMVIEDKFGIYINRRSKKWRIIYEKYFLKCLEFFKRVLDLYVRRMGNWVILFGCKWKYLLFKCIVF